ncbi:MAG: SDR family oxidoreductase [Myxococcota bacterium]
MLDMISYCLPLALRTVVPPVDLQQRFPGPEPWALVTGASTGLGRSIAPGWRGKGIHVVLVGLADQALQRTVKELRKGYPQVNFRMVGCRFAVGEDYLAAIDAQTHDIPVRFVFNNAGYVLMGPLDEVGIDGQLDNIECQVNAPVRITDLFYKRMVKQGYHGVFAFTSSPGAISQVPSGPPMAVRRHFCQLTRRP